MQGAKIVTALSIIEQGTHCAPVPHNQGSITHAVVCLPLDFSPLHAYTDSLFCITLFSNVVNICNSLDDCCGYRAHLFQQGPFSWQ